MLQGIASFTAVSLMVVFLCVFFFFFPFAASLCDAMKKRRENPVVHEIGDVLLARVRPRHSASVFYPHREVAQAQILVHENKIKKYWLAPLSVTSTQ